MPEPKEEVITLEPNQGYADPRIGFSFRNRTNKRMKYTFCGGRVLSSVHDPKPDVELPNKLTEMSEAFQSFCRDMGIVAVETSTGRSLKSITLVLEDGRHAKVTVSE